MLIQVKYLDGEIETVPSSLLNELIDLKEIVAFKRSNGWVYIGQDHIRNKLKPFKGPGLRAYDIYL